MFRRVAKISSWEGGILNFYIGETVIKPDYLANQYAFIYIAFIYIADFWVVSWIDQGLAHINLQKYGLVIFGQE